MRQARYEIVEDDGSFYGEIPAIPGVWANARTLEACREELESVLEGWVLVSIAAHSPIPDIDGKFTEKLSRPHVVPQDLDASYRDMAADQAREGSALEWSEGVIADSSVPEPHTSR